MYADCHIHMVLDGVYYKDAIAAHRQGPREDLIRPRLEAYRSLGFTYLRDGGDRWGVGRFARDLAGAYGITYRTPLFPIYKRGHYGGFIGRSFDTMEAYKALVQEVRTEGGDFVKIMISGLMDFDRFGVLTSSPLEPQEIREMIRIAHGAGFAVMAHANGAQAVLAAAEAGVDSVEHGAYLSGEALEAMAEAGTVWVPTLATIGNLRYRPLLGSRCNAHPDLRPRECGPVPRPGRPPGSRLRCRRLCRLSRPRRLGRVPSPVRGPGPGSRRRTLPGHFRHPAAVLDRDLGS